jgi:tetratricopeptide (TPR) repeat protein
VRRRHRAYPTSCRPFPIKLMQGFHLLFMATMLGVQMHADSSDVERAYNEYRAAAEAYARCDDHAALRFITSHDSGELKLLSAQIADPNETATRGGRVPWPSRTLAAAMLLHERAAVAVPDSREVEEELAAEFLDRLIASKPPSELREPAYALATVRLQFDGDIGGLVYLLSRLPEDLRKRSFFLLAIGSVHELLSTPLASLREAGWGHTRELGPQPDNWGRRFVRTARSSKRSNRNAAMTAYHDALLADPANTEARLRLAFLMTEDGRTSQAESLLRTTQHVEQPPILGYLAALVRARLAERESRLEEAVARYSEAATLVPEAQTPTIARARIRLLQGDAAGARVIIARDLPHASASPDADPWWRYLFGQTWRAQEFLDRLDKVVRTCDAP